MIVPEFKIKRGNNGKGREYCSSSKGIVEAAIERGLTRADIARITGADRRTISGWLKDEQDGGGADCNLIRPLYDYLTGMNPAIPEKQKPNDAPNYTPLLNALSPDSLGEEMKTLLSVLASQNKTLAIVDLPNEKSLSEGGEL